MNIYDCLILENSPLIASAIRQSEELEGLHLCFCDQPLQALEMVQTARVEVVVLDTEITQQRSGSFIAQLLQEDPQIQVIVLDGESQPMLTDPQLISSLFETYHKPFGINHVCHSIRRALDYRWLRSENQRLKQAQLSPASPFPTPPSGGQSKGSDGAADSTGIALVGKSRAIFLACQCIEEVANSDITVLIRGESGTGKELVARMIHEHSSRANKGNFVKVHCPAIPETLLESELFGHEAGAFTGANSCKPGRFEQARGGTLFLDEIADIPTHLQVKLLQAIEQKQFVRLGGQKTITVDTRIVAATNAPLEQMMRDHHLRPDLYYRINEFCITLPPLRERREDIPVLARFFLESCRNSYALPLQPLSDRLIDAILSYDWPGNVRELQSVMRRLILTGQEDPILVELDRRADRSQATERENRNVLNESERQIILLTLLRARWNQRQASKMLGISYSTLRRKIDKYDLKNHQLDPADLLMNIPT